MLVDADIQPAKEKIEKAKEQAEGVKEKTKENNSEPK